MVREGVGKRMSVNVLLDEMELVKDALKSIMLLLEQNKEKLDKLLASGTFERSDSPERVKEIEAMDRMVEREITVKEELEMDFKGVTVMNQTEKALLVVKKGHQQWLAKQFIKDPLIEYFAGNVYDVELKEQSDAGKPINWVSKKWVPFEVYKR